MAPGLSNGDGETACMHQISGNGEGRTIAWCTLRIWTWSSHQSHHRHFYLHCTSGAR